MIPTQEQTNAVDAFLTGDNLTIEAGAGTGKTSTLKLISTATPKRGLYLAYNRAIAQESSASFPNNVQCRTAHSVAFRWTASKWGSDVLLGRIKSQRMPAWDLARALRSNDPVKVADDLILAPTRVASIAMQTVQRWCYTGDDVIKRSHLPRINRIDSDESEGRLAEAVLPMAARAWEDLSRADGKLSFKHDHYLKLWALSRPDLDFDFVLVDEAQDSNGVVTDVVKRQSCQVAAVGDRNQSIYGWRGATDAMDAFGSKHHVYLTQSFRFGPAIAAEANKWLDILGAPLRLQGYPEIRSVLSDTPHTRAVLCRTNAAAIQTVIGSHVMGTKVALVGDGREISSFARAARELMDRGSTSHHELFPFDSWSMVKEYVEDAYDGAELAVLVKLVDDYSPEGVIRAVEGCVNNESDAEVTVSTAHKAKGREWESVRIADDFDRPDDLEGFGPEAMLAYVAVTRARKVLNRGALAWIDELVSANQATREEA